MMYDVEDVRYRSLVDLTAMEVWAPRSLVIDLVWSQVAGMRYFAIVFRRASRNVLYGLRDPPTDR